jgi:hypothetical protein
MRNANRLLLVFILLTIDCASQQLTPLQRAELIYTEASLGYETAQDVIVTARTNHQVSDAQWRAFDSAQAQVQQAAPKVRALLSLWRTAGQKPDGFDGALAFLKMATDAAIAVQKEAHP